MRTLPSVTHQVRGLPDLKMLGLPRNVLVWDGEQLGTWLDALGLGQVVPAFLDHNINGGTVPAARSKRARALAPSL